MKARYIGLLAAVAGFAVAIPATGSRAAPDLYVAPGGDDGNGCTAAAPCKSFARAYSQAQGGTVVHVAAGHYVAQDFAGGIYASQPAGTKDVTFRADGSVTLDQLIAYAPNLHFDGINVDAQGKNPGNGPSTSFNDATLDLNGNNVSFVNGSVGNVVDQKGAQAGGAHTTFDNVQFHDVMMVNPAVHNECLYAESAEALTIKNSTFTNCATMDLYFTSCTWCSPPDGPYGNVTLVNNVFNHSTCDGCRGVPAGWHYYGVVVGNTGAGGDLHGWTVENNVVEQDVIVNPHMGAGNTFCGNTKKGPFVKHSLWPNSWTKACPGPPKRSKPSRHAR